MRSTRRWGGILFGRWRLASPTRFGIGRFKAALRTWGLKAVRVSGVGPVPETVRDEDETQVVDG